MLKPTKRQRVVSVTTFVITTIGVSLGSVETTLALEPQRMPATSHLTSARLNVLENALWACDYVATRRGASDIDLHCGLRRAPGPQVCRRL
jgi:hypothetical protein